MKKDFFKDLDSQINLINNCLKEGKQLPNSNSYSVEISNFSDTLVEEKIEDDDNVYDIVKKARKVDFNQISYARDSYLQMMDLNNRLGLDIKYEPDYKYSVDSLRNVCISELIREDKERDSYWVLDFTKELVETAKKEIDSNASFKFVDGQCVRTNIVTPKSIRKYIKKLMCFKSDADKEFLNLLDDVLQYNFDKECAGVPIIVEESLKRDLLEEDFDSLNANFEDMTIDELVEFNIYHCCSPMLAKKILLVTKSLLDEGYTPKDIDLKVEDDWEFIIKSFLNDEYFIEDEEFGYESLSKQLEEEDKQMFVDIKMEMKEKAIKNKANVVAENAKQSITIKCITTNEVLEFETKGECMRYLKTSPNTFSQSPPSSLSDSPGA